MTRGVCGEEREAHQAMAAVLCSLEQSSVELARREKLRGARRRQRAAGRRRGRVQGRGEVSRLAVKSKARKKKRELGW